ncbi:DUF7504 family protein [Natronomonas sp. EA1]|uniref:DUF7504 family protein n=1 Tax=Natronomonas sp. EA1 TaxID=3421655 RepID=UPI003EBF2DC4
MTHRGGHTRPFEQFLAALKRDGCALLVTGDEPALAREVASKRLFGTTRPDAETAPRKRLLLTTGKGECPAAYLPGELTGASESTTVVSTTTATRATVARPPAEDPEPRSLAAVSAELHEALSALIDDEPRPSELRVGVTSIRPLLEEYGPRETRQFVSELAETVRGYRGMAHVHYPVADDSPAVETVEPVVDARIELRMRERASVELRWHTGDETLDDGLSWHPVV